MATIIFYQAVDMRVWNFVDEPELTVTPTVITATGASGELATYHGTFFEADGAGDVIGGSVWSIAFTIDGELQYFMSGGGGASALFDSLAAEDPLIARSLFLANDRVVGSRYADILHGYSAWDDMDGGGGNDTLYGGGGKDSLLGGLGVDRLYAGGGHDTMRWDPKDFFDGGPDADTLEIVSDLNLRQVSDSRILDVEQIVFLGGAADTLTLNRDDVLALSSTSDKLSVLGEPGDRVDLRGAFTLESTSGDFEIWKLGAAIVRIEVELDVI
jgi:Ca2+-binding RTX toxin-like protein